MGADKFLAIGYSSKCNNTCQYCLTRPAFPKDITMSFETAKSIILQAKTTGISGISFTVGEPLLYLKDIKKLVELCNHLNIKTRIVTNAFWAATKELSDDLVKDLKKSGLNQIRISCSRMHQRNIPLENVINAAKSSIQYGLDYFISLITDVSEEDKQLENKLKENNIKYSKEPLIPFGKAFESKNINILYTDSIKKCKMLPVITPDLNFYACCGAGAYFTKTNIFFVGNLKNERLEDIYNRFSQNKIYSIIENTGLVDIANKLGINQYLSLQRCKLCEKLFNSEENLKKIKYDFAL